AQPARHGAGREGQDVAIGPVAPGLQNGFDLVVSREHRGPVEPHAVGTSGRVERIADAALPVDEGSIAVEGEHVEASHAKAAPRSQSSSRPITRRRISEVPPPGSRKRASRKYRCTGYSIARPYDAKIRAASSVTLTAVSDAISFAIAASRPTGRCASSRPAA